MTKKIKKSELSEREKYLLKLTDRKSFAFRNTISLKTLDLWCELGLPFVGVGWEKYFDPDEVSIWLELENKSGDGMNIDMLWERTPDDLLPRKNYNTADGQCFFLILNSSNEKAKQVTK